jgi:hypothetical protein
MNYCPTPYPLLFQRAALSPLGLALSARHPAASVCIFAVCPPSAHYFRPRPLFLCAAPIHLCSNGARRGQGRATAADTQFCRESDFRGQVGWERFVGAGMPPPELPARRACAHAPRVVSLSTPRGSRELRLHEGISIPIKIARVGWRVAWRKSTLYTGANGKFVCGLPGKNTVIRPGSLASDAIVTLMYIR